jgi:hypothetical protein
MLSIAMGSNAYPYNLNSNLSLTISPLVSKTLDLMEKEGERRARLEKCTVAGMADGFPIGSVRN